MKNYTGYWGRGLGSTYKTSLKADKEDWGCGKVDFVIYFAIELTIEFSIELAVELAIELTIELTI